jgi:hypothetical protein
MEPTLNFKPAPTPESTREAFTAALNEMVMRSHLAVENMTQEQLVDLIRQMIESGDIVKYVREGLPHTQNLVYMPYAELAKVREQRDQEAWGHAVCASVAENGNLPEEPSIAQQAIRQLWLEKEKWRKFSLGIIDAAKEHLAEGSCDENDQAIIESCVEYGLANVRRVIYDPEVHGEMQDAEPGKEIFYWGKDREVGIQLPSTEGWQCDCGAKPEPSDPSWRWNGSFWEHHHGHPIGHVQANRIALTPQ